MTSTTENKGRLGNQIFRNIAVSLIAEKHNLLVYNYASNENISKLGIKLFSGKNKYEYFSILNDDNYFTIYNTENLNTNLDPNYDYFQTKEISNFIYQYLNSNDIKSNIINNNEFKNRYNNNNDCYIHIRLDDAAHFNPGINYYLEVLNKIKYDNLYISTDEPTHNIIKEITNKYPKSNILLFNEINTIKFASTCKNIILSHGSFSAIIGYLSFYSTINYPEYQINKIWYGDMFSIDNWIKHSLS